MYNMRDSTMETFQSAAASVSAEQQKDRQQQQVRRLKELNIKRRQEKVVKILFSYIASCEPFLVLGTPPHELFKKSNLNHFILETETWGSS